MRKREKKGERNGWRGVADEEGRKRLTDAKEGRGERGEGEGERNEMDTEEEWKKKKGIR